MRARFILPALLVAFSAAAVCPARGQTLADVARKEAERRKTVKEPPKTFTNDDLPNASPRTSSGSAAGTPAADTGADKSADGKGATDKPADTRAEGAADAGAKDQAYWSGKMKTLRDSLEQDHVLADAVQTRVSSLVTDFVNRDDPAQRAVVAADKQKATDELTRLQKAIVDDTKAIGDLEEEARRAGVPPGWLR